MAQSAIFTTEYRNSEYTVWFTHHPNGFTFKVKVDDLPWRECHDEVHPSYVEAHSVAIKLAELLIDQLKG